MSYLDRLLVRTGVEAAGLPRVDRAPPAPLEVEATRVVVAASPASTAMPVESAVALAADRPPLIAPAPGRSQQMISTEVTREIGPGSSAMGAPAPAPASAEPAEIVIEMRTRPATEARSEAGGVLPPIAANPLEPREASSIPLPTPEKAATGAASPSLTLLDVRRWVSQTPDPEERAVVTVDVAGESRRGVVEPPVPAAAARPAIPAWHPIDAPVEAAQAPVQHITVGIGTVELTVEAVPDTAPPPVRNTVQRVAEPEPSFSRLARRYLRA